MHASPKNINPTKAIIYCRVSGAKQATQGHGLESQESRCREHTDKQGYQVVAVFPDDISGGGDFMNRPGMVALLSFLDAQPNQNYVVVFDDLKRFARDTEFHIKLRRELKVRGASVECLNFKFEDTPEGNFIETVISAQGELEREQNKRQVVQKMSQRIKAGYSVFQAPIGYRYEAVAGHGKILVRDEPVASIIQEALEGFATGRFETQVELKRFFEGQPLFPKDLPNEQVRQQKVTDILSRPIYAGYIDNPKWGISLRKAQHEGLVSLETFEKIQDNRKSQSKAPARKDINEDFPLRGAVVCADCGNPYTACWSTSSTGVKHPYYLCQTKSCESYRKSIRRDVLEGAFEEALRSMTPSKGLFEIVKSMFADAWEQRRTQMDAGKDELRKQKLLLDGHIESAVDKIMTLTNTTAVSALEKRIDDLESQKLVLDEKLENFGKPIHSFSEMFELSLDFISSPWKIWASGQLSLKRTVLRLAFSERIAYSRKTGLRTPQVSVPFEFFNVFTKKCEMVPPHGLEPRTY
jgi:site-specific DNA recombinase